jgi:hypothetical protein
VRRARLEPARPYAPGGVIASPVPIPVDDRPPSFLVRLAREVAADEARRVREEWERLRPSGGVLVLGPGAEFIPAPVALPAEPVVAVPTCVCGDRGTHRPEPGVGCTRPGCLCLEPGEPAPRPPAPPDTSWLRMELIR